LAKYYFTLASLPELQLFVPAPISVEQFFDRCAAEVKERDMHYLRKTAEGDWSFKHPVTDAWNQYMDDLKHELAYQRSERQGRKQERTRLTNRDIQDAARHILHQKHPLESEREYIRFQWELLDRLESGYFFDSRRLILYLMKLLIALRYAQFDTKEGENQFEEVFSSVRSRIESL